jgi:hypothetical protein
LLKLLALGNRPHCSSFFRHVIAGDCLALPHFPHFVRDRQLQKVFDASDVIESNMTKALQQLIFIRICNAVRAKPFAGISASLAQRCEQYLSAACFLATKCTEPKPYEDMFRQFLRNEVVAVLSAGGRWIFGLSDWTPGGVTQRLAGSPTQQRRTPLVYSVLGQSGGSNAADSIQPC